MARERRTVSESSQTTSEKSTCHDFYGFKDKFLPDFDGSWDEWMKRPTGKMLTEMFGKMSLYGLGHPYVGGTFEPPEVELESSSSNPTVSCKNFMEIPPVESYHILNSPFLPVQWSSDLDCESYDHASFVASEDHAAWRKKILEKESLVLVGKSLNECHTKTYAGEKTSSKFRYPEEYYKLLNEYPFAPSSLYSSSCIKKLRIDENQYLLAADNSGNVKVAMVSPSSKTALTEDISHKMSFRKPGLGENSRVYGLSTSLKNNLVALKYWDGVAVAKLSLSKDSLTSNFVFTQACNQCHINDVAFCDILDSVVTISSNGSVISSDLQTGKTFGCWNDVYSEQVSNFNWASVNDALSSPYLLRIGSRKSINIFDLRKGSDVLEMYRFNKRECLGAMTASQSSPFQFYCSTNFSTYLLDERFLAEPVWFTDHSSTRKNKDIPAGSNTFIEPKTGLEYVSVVWSDGDVMLFVNDYSHNVCAKRAGHLPSVLLSCQSQRKDAEKIHPVLRGIPIAVPSVNYLLNTCSNLNQRASNRLLIPWVGVETLSVSDDLLTLFGLNAVGDLFAANIKTSKSRGDLLNLERIGPSSKIKTSKCDFTCLPTDALSPAWLFDGQDRYKLDELKTKSKAAIHDWQNRVLNTESWSKINVVTNVFIRHKTGDDDDDETGMDDLDSQPGTKKKKKKIKSSKLKAVKVHKKVGRKEKTIKLPDSLPKAHFILEEKYSNFAKKIVSMLNGDYVIEDVQFSDDESSIYLQSDRSIKRHSSSYRSSHVRSEASISSLEKSISKEGFERGLMQQGEVSTQQDTQMDFFNLTSIRGLPTSEKTRAWLDNQTEPQMLEDPSRTTGFDGSFLNPGSQMFTQSDQSRVLRSQKKAKKKFRTGF